MSCMVEIKVKVKRKFKVEVKVNLYGLQQLAQTCQLF